jgi:hypothetical protein
LRNSAAIDQLQTTELLIEKSCPPSGLMSNVNAQGVGVNAYGGVRRRWHVQPSERRPQERSGWQEVAHGILPTLQTYLIAYEQRVSGSLSTYKEVQTGTIGRRDARDTLSANAQLGLRIVPLEHDFTVYGRQFGHRHAPGRQRARERPRARRTGSSGND